MDYSELAIYEYRKVFKGSILPVSKQKQTTIATNNTSNKQNKSLVREMLQLCYCKDTTSNSYNYWYIIISLWTAGIIKTKKKGSDSPGLTWGCLCDQEVWQ